MLTLYRLPYFLDYLAKHYQQLHATYVGRLTELFPSAQSSDETLLIKEDETTPAEQTERVRRLWKRFVSRF